GGSTDPGEAESGLCGQFAGYGESPNSTLIDEGLGSRLLEVAKHRRPDGLQLWTFEANRGARRLYERHGFIATEATDVNNEEGAPAVRYWWRPR
ncbi:MAG TPA: GNAT family N-acetyltransferase, partial [Acidimicrobiales bacterium]|nr:GNAT family N-acetyltransferase [Acidimicrobiales bacterium]